jgi:hypothetical protein
MFTYACICTHKHTHMRTQQACSILNRSHSQHLKHVCPSFYQKPRTHARARTHTHTRKHRHTHTRTCTRTHTTGMQYLDGSRLQRLEPFFLPQRQPPSVRQHRLNSQSVASPSRSRCCGAYNERPHQGCEQCEHLEQ